METRESIAPPSFDDELAYRRELVEPCVVVLAESLRDEAAQHGPDMAAAAASYLSLFEQPGKRTRGVLTVLGYELFGGSADDEAIASAAAIVEAMHAYLLVIDDVQDQSDTRRGNPTAHVYMDRYLQQTQATGNTKTLGENVANTAALWAQHRAHKVLRHVELPLEDRDEALRRKDLAGDILDDGLALTGVGQILDLFSTARPDMSLADAQKIAVYKTAFYSYLLPLQVGAALAGASREQLEALQDYALEAGLAFQMQDDLIGSFSTEEQTGKPPKNDMVEGKRTILFLTAMDLADDEQRKVLEDALGNADLTDEAFAESLAVIQATGAYDEVALWKEVYVRRAIDAIEQAGSSNGWPWPQVQFLKDMALYGANRSR